MRYISRAAAIMLTLASVPAPALAQATYEGHPIDVVGEIRGGPRGEPGGGGGAGSGNAGDRNRAGGRSSVPAEKTTTVTVGDQDFTVSVAASAELTDFINEYRQVSAAGQTVSAFAGLFTLFNLFQMEPAPSIIAAVHNPVSAAFDADEIALSLSAVSTWNTAMRVKAVNFLKFKMLDAARKPGARAEFQMWKALRNIIEFPERYENGGIRRDPAGAIALRGETGADLAQIPGSQVFAPDQVELGLLTEAMMSRGEPHAWVWQADYWYYLWPHNGGVGGLTMRDEMLINQALYLASPQNKPNLRARFRALRNTVGHSPMLWSRFIRYIDNPDAWREHIYVWPDQSEDSLGFPVDEPYMTRLVYLAG